MKHSIILSFLLGAVCSVFAGPCTGNDKPMAMIPDPEDCQNYYMCLGEDHFHEYCNDEEIFDIVEGICKNKNEATCVKDIMATTIIKDTTLPPTTAATETVEPTTEQIKTTVKEIKPVEPIQEINICDGIEEFTEVPDPENCKSYYFCMGSDSMHLDCSGNEIFDIKTNRCNNPEESTCIRDENVSIEETPKTTLKTTTVSTTTFKPTTTKVVQSNDCPPNEIAYLPHLNDCNKFYQCYFGHKSLRKCPAGLHWNAKYSVCTKPSFAECIN